jgi:CRP-like cAMP-binding protein
MIDNGRERRLMTFGPGGVFGEMGFLDLAPRSATVVADESLQCLVLDRHAFDEVAREHPTVAIKILAALGRELSARLRLVNRAIVQIDS